MTKLHMQTRFEKALASIVERDGYCLVASESEEAMHVVTVDVNFYSQSCTCKGAAHGNDCYHRLAVDRYFDSRRPSFSAMCEQPAAAVTIGEAMTAANESMQTAIADEAVQGDKSYREAQKPLDDAYASLAEWRTATARRMEAIERRLEADFVETVAHIEAQQSQAGTCRYCGRMARKDVCPACAGC